MERIITCSAPVNIAVIKYWGKREENLVLPLNDSISFTLSQEEMCAMTTVMMSPRFTSDRIWLNHKEEDINNPRILSCLKEVRRRASKRKHGSETPPNFSWHFHICSENNFPTAAGLASSAAGYACLVFTLGHLLEVGGNLSSVARLGSGSACRSLEGGIVRWHRGRSDDGSDSIATQVAPPNHWPDLRVIICVANSGRKKTSSTDGMRRSVETSFLLKCRTGNSVLRRTEEMMQAIKNKDWSAFCDLAMTDSNEMHAVCMDTFPPCVYMNDTSHAVVSLVHQYNYLKTKQNKEEQKVCYTFDAGPNACLFVRGKVVNEVGALLNRCFPSHCSTSTPEKQYWQGIPLNTASALKNVESLLTECEQETHSVKYFIHTRVGGGPIVLPDDDAIHLIDRSTGLPKTTTTTSCPLSEEDNGPLLASEVPS